MGWVLCIMTFVGACFTHNDTLFYVSSIYAIAGALSTIATNIKK